MLAVLNFDGKIDDAIDLFMISVMIGNKQFRDAFSRVVGMGSKIHDLLFPSIIIFFSHLPGSLV